MMDKDYTEKLEMEEHHLVPESVHNTSRFEGVRFHGEMSQVHVVAQGFGAKN